MVFELTDELAKYKPEQQELLSRCLENLLIGFYEGNLILIISRPLCTFFRAKNLVKSDTALLALHYIEENGGYIPDVLWHIKIVLDNPEVSKHELSYSFFAETKTIQPTSFLCENIDDVKFYMKLVSIYYPDTFTSACFYHGGGGTTVDVFLYLKKQKVISLVILDSDVKYPGCVIGDTARRCKNQYKEQTAYIEMKVLNVHEAENLVPLAYMKSHTYDKEGRKFLEKMSQRGLLHLMRYYDIKKGIRKDRAIENTNYLSFCKDLYEKLYPYRKNSFENYLNQKRKNEDRLFPAIRVDMLHEFNKDNKGPYPVDDMESDRKEIAALVHTFVCCRGHDPIN